MSEVDFIYYNFLLHNSSDVDQVAEFTETRNDAIITNAQDWDLAVARFSIPGITIPLFSYRENIYWVAIQKNSNMDIYVEQVKMQWKQNNSPATSSVTNQVFDYQLWIDNVNLAIGSAVVNAGITSTPIAYYAGPNDIGIYVQESPTPEDNYYPYDTSPPAGDRLKLFMSRQLYLQFFSGCEAERLDVPLDSSKFFPAEPTVPVKIEYHLDYLLKFVSRPNNTYTGTTRFPGLTADIVDNNNQFPCSFGWTKLRRIILATSSIQVNSEQIGASRDGRTYSQQMLTDFELPIDAHPLNRQTIYYQPSTFRYVSILSDSQIRKMDIKIYYQDYDTLELYPLLLPPGFDINIKVQFRRIRQSENLLSKLVKILSLTYNKQPHDQEAVEDKQRTRNIDLGYKMVIPKKPVGGFNVPSTWN